MTELPTGGDETAPEPRHDQPSPDAPAESGWTIELANEAATVALARSLASALNLGDLVTLSGDLGAGKTAFARALIRTLAADPWLEVPSPTFTLMQLYDTSFGAIVHADLYRVNDPEELAELGWDEASDDALVLVEWPERAASALAPDRLDIALKLRPDGRDASRVAVLTGFGAWAERLKVARAVRAVLRDAGWTDAMRTHVQGDASTRAYERLTEANGDTAVLMIAPRRSDGPPVRRGKPYSAIAKLAESVHAFVALAKGLRALGLSAPNILGADLEAGVLLIEDLGSEPVVDDDGPIAERYEEAARVLARLHGTALPQILPVAEGVDHALPPYDLEALLIEIELVLDWYAPHVAKLKLPPSVRAAFVSAWTGVLAEVLAAPATWTLRDYHSPNLLWLPRRQGLARVGILDFQDAVLGHPAYDAVSLMQDARLTVDPHLEMRLLGAYARARSQADKDFDLAAFARAYAILGGQRATRLLGTFTRLDKRDGKPQYLKHLRRVEAYLARNLAHPVLSPLKLWYETHLPRVFHAG